MNILQKAKIFSSLAIIFFAVCVIIGFSAAGKFNIEEFMIFSYFFGITSICFMLLWGQIFYRFMKINETVLENNKECCTSLQQLLTTTLNNSDYLFQKSLCLILAIAHCYQSISLMFTQYIILWIYMQYIEYMSANDDEEYGYYRDEDYIDTLKNEVYGSEDQYNVIIYMQLLSLAFGTYIQVSIFKRLFFKVIDGKKEQILLLNKNLSPKDEEVHQNNVVTHAIIFLFLWIALLKIRVGVYISFYVEEIDKLTAFNKNKELFQGWFILVTSIMHSEFVKIIGVFLLLLMLTQTIFGFIVIKDDYIILKLALSDLLAQNLLLVDTIAVTILFCYHFFQFLLNLIHPNTLTLNQPFQFQQTNFQPPARQSYEFELQLTPDNQKKQDN